MDSSNYYFLVLSERCAKDNGGCSHICVEINAGTHICLCPDGMVRAPASVNSLNETCSCPDGETLDGKFCKSGLSANWNTLLCAGNCILQFEVASAL